MKAEPFVFSLDFLLSIFPHLSLVLLIYTFHAFANKKNYQLPYTFF